VGGDTVTELPQDLIGLVEELNFDTLDMIAIQRFISHFRAQGATHIALDGLVGVKVSEATAQNGDGIEILLSSTEFDIDHAPGLAIDYLSGVLDQTLFLIERTEPA
jgi:hypothetical protein